MKGFTFPSDVPGWLSEAEGRLLYDLAGGKTVLEAGSYCGRSTVCLSQSARCVVAVDPHDSRGIPSGGGKDTWAEFQKAIFTHGLMHKVKAMRCPLEKLNTDGLWFDLAFIDTDHNYRVCRRHAVICASMLARGGLLAFHDYGRDGDEEVTVCVDGILAGGGRLVHLLDSGDDHLAVVDPGTWRKTS